MKFLYFSISCLVFFILFQVGSFCFNRSIVREVQILGQKNTPQILLENIYLKIMKKPIINLDINELRKEIISIDFVKDAVIKRKLCGKITIELQEKEPIAYFYKDSKKYLIDKDGNLINLTERRFNIPKVYGEDANLHANYIIEIVSKFPKIKERVLGFVFLRKYRWNLILKKNITIKLPSDNIDYAISSLNKIIDDMDKFEISDIDLRIFGKIFIKPSH